MDELKEVCKALDLRDENKNETNKKVLYVVMRLIKKGIDLSFENKCLKKDIETLQEIYIHNHDGELIRLYNEEGLYSAVKVHMIFNKGTTIQESKDHILSLVKK